MHDAVVTAIHGRGGNGGRSIPGSSCSHWGQCPAVSRSAEGRGGTFPRGSHGHPLGEAGPPQPHTAEWQTAGGAPSGSQRQHTFWGGGGGGGRTGDEPKPNLPTTHFILKLPTKD